MMSEAFLTRISDTLDTIRAEGLWKTERPIVSPQGGHISVAPDGRDMLNLCANNYLGLADHPALIAAAKAAMDEPRLRHGERALHLRHTGPAPGAGGTAGQIPRQGRHDPVRGLFRRQRRASSSRYWAPRTR
jgi:7-keto-8-aminopelargonate synthetase-like enzyme